MRINKLLMKSSEKLKALDIEKKNIIVWGMGYVAVLYENAFKRLGIKIYAYTSKDASNEKLSGGG